MGGSLELANPGEPGACFAFWLRAADRGGERSPRAAPKGTTSHDSAEGDGIERPPAEIDVDRAPPARSAGR
jgi:hypothetical protein